MNCDAMQFSGLRYKAARTLSAQKVQWETDTQDAFDLMCSVACKSLCWSLTPLRSSLYAIPAPATRLPDSLVTSKRTRSPLAAFSTHSTGEGVSNARLSISACDRQSMQRACQNQRAVASTAGEASLVTADANDVTPDSVLTQTSGNCSFAKVHQDPGVSRRAMHRRWGFTHL